MTTDLAVWRRFNSMDAADAGGESLWTTLLESGRRWRDKAAIVSGQTSVTYGELWAHAAALSRDLTAAGVGPGARVALEASRSPRFYAGLLACMGVGAAYVVLDGPAGTDMFKRQSHHAGVVAVLSEPDMTGPPTPGAAGPEGFDSDDLALYVLFTSGTAGRPKAVEIARRGVLNLVNWYRRAYEVDHTSRIAQNAAPTFDASAMQYMVALASGATLHPVPNDVRIDPEEFSTWIDDTRVTHLDVVPSHLWHLVTALERGRPDRWADVRWVVAGGESLPWTLVERLRSVAPRVGVSQVYGPTEATVNSTWMKVASLRGDATGTNVPLGVPLPNYGVSVVDATGALVPTNVVGEIVITGEGLAIGYVDPATTADRFRPAPGGARAYYTGDLGRLRMVDGEPCLEYVGRRDAQVKLAGTRVDPDEVARSLRSFPGIDDCAVIAHDTGAGPALACFIVGTDRVDELAVRSYLLSMWRPAAVPTRFAQLDRLPLAATGKIDKAQLSRLLEHTVEGSIHAASDLERDIGDEWANAVGRAPCASDDHFFLSGGTSVLAMGLLGNIRLRWGVDIRGLDFRRDPTFGALVGLVERGLAAPGDIGATVPTRGPERWNVAAADVVIPMSVHDARVYAVGPAAPWPDLLARLRFVGVDADTIADAAVAVATAHPLLAATPSIEQGRRVFAVRAPAHVDVIVVDGPGRDVTAEVSQGRLAGTTSLRVAVATHEQSTDLLVALDHRVADGQSRELIVAQLVEAIRTGVPPRPESCDGYMSYESTMRAVYQADPRRVDAHLDAIRERLPATLAALEGQRRASEALETTWLAGVGQWSPAEILGEFGVALGDALDQEAVVGLFEAHGRAYTFASFFDLVANTVDAVPIVLGGSAGRGLAEFLTTEPWRRTNFRAAALDDVELHAYVAGLDGRPRVRVAMVDSPPRRAGDALRVAVDSLTVDEPGTINLTLEAQRDANRVVLSAVGFDARWFASLREQLSVRLGVGPMGRVEAQR